MDVSMKLLRIALFSTLAVSASPTAVFAATATVMVSHRAVYELSLLRADGNKAPRTARGRIAFDFIGSACEGYSQNFRQLTELQSDEGAPRVSDMRSATFEDGDGRNFRFKVETDVDQAPAELTDGRAVRAADGGLSVDLSHPKKAKLDLARDVAFPTEHLRHVIEAARAGQKLVAIKVYDGSETGEKVFDTTTVIGASLTGPADDASTSVPDLAKLARWPVSISYFEQGKADSQPNYVLSFDLYENGISRELKLDYGDFALLGHMVKLEMLPTKACAK